MVNAWLTRNIKIGNSVLISNVPPDNLGQQEARKSISTTAPARATRKAKLWVLSLRLERVRVVLRYYRRCLWTRIQANRAPLQTWLYAQEQHLAASGTDADQRR